jgi:amino acid transporter, AAT family
VAIFLIMRALKGPFLALQAVMFAFLGVELIGVTAGEAQKPEKTIPSGDQQGDLADPDLLHRRAGHHHVAGRLEPPEPSQSPFVMVFSKIGIPTAAGIINFVVLTAALSSCNSGLFSTGRTRR